MSYGRKSQVACPDLWFKTNFQLCRSKPVFRSVVQNQSSPHSFEPYLPLSCSKPIFSSVVQKSPALSFKTKHHLCRSREVSVTESQRVVPTDLAPQSVPGSRQQGALYIHCGQPCALSQPSPLPPPSISDDITEIEIDILAHLHEQLTYQRERERERGGGGSRGPTVLGAMQESHATNTNPRVCTIDARPPLGSLRHIVLGPATCGYRLRVSFVAPFGTAGSCFTG